MYHRLSPTFSTGTLLLSSLFITQTPAQTVAAQYYQPIEAPPEGSPPGGEFQGVIPSSNLTTLRPSKANHKTQQMIKRAKGDGPEAWSACSFITSINAKGRDEQTQAWNPDCDTYVLEGHVNNMPPPPTGFPFSTLEIPSA